MFTLPAVAYLPVWGATAYLAMLAAIVHYWRRPPLRTSASPLKPLPYIDVLIAARNEEKLLPACIQSLLQQQYPADRVTFWLIDDHSEDATAAVVAQFLHDPRLRLLSLASHLQGRQVASYKKEALGWAIAQSAGELIVTTDADCELPPGWLAAVAAAWQQGYDFIGAPVRIRDTGCLLTSFQALDVAGTMLLTGAACRAGSPLLANGANMAFSRALFERVGGYAGIDHIASGDDVLLLQKALRDGQARIGYVTDVDAIVTTAAQHSWCDLWQQRLRWASKTATYKDIKLVVFQVFVFFLSWSILLALLLAPPSGIAALAIKYTGDFFFLHIAVRSLQQPQAMRWFWLTEPLHILYIALLGVAALLPLPVAWKKRRTLQ